LLIDPYLPTLPDKEVDDACGETWGDNRKGEESERLTRVGWFFIQG